MGLLVRWGTDLLDALVELEREGVDHRDLKPENLVFIERGKSACGLLGHLRMLADGSRDLQRGLVGVTGTSYSPDEVTGLAAGMGMGDS
jgi:serine/threonine protein kinase